MTEVFKPVKITVDTYPGWETSISPYRLTVDNRTYRQPMTADEVRKNLDLILSYKIGD